MRSVVALLVLGLALRLGAAELISFKHVNDPADYIRTAKSLAETGTYPQSVVASGPSANRAPLYPVVLAGVFRLPGDDVALARAFTALLGTLVAGLTGWLAALLWNRRVGVIALGLVAVAPALILMSITLMTETLFMALMLLAIIAVLLARERRGLAWVLAAGALAGLAALSRPNGLLVVAVLAPALWWVPRRSARSLVPPVAFLAVVAVVLTPWAVRNHERFGEFIPVATSAWYTASGMYNETTRTDPAFPAMWRTPDQDPAIARVLRAHPREGELERGARLRELSLDTIREHPLFPFEAVARNTLRFAHVMDFGLAKDSWESDGLERWPAPIANVGFMALLALAAAGLVLGAPRRTPWWIWLLPVLLVASVAAVGTAIRYRTPADPFVILLAAYAIERLWRGGRPADEPGAVAS